MWFLLPGGFGVWFFQQASKSVTTQLKLSKPANHSSGSTKIQRVLYANPQRPTWTNRYYQQLGENTEHFSAKKANRYHWNESYQVQGSSG